jgi:hypothetical protein
MAQSPKQLANLKPIKKGEVRNPLGGKTQNPALRALRKLTIKEYSEVIELALTSNVAALKDIIKHPETSAIQVGVAMALIKAINAGDWTIIEAIAARIVGKLPDRLEVTSNNDTKITHIDEAKLSVAIQKLENDV